MSRWDDIVNARIELDPPEPPITKGYAERYVDRYADITFGPPVEPSCRLCGAHGRVARVRIHGEDSAVCLPCNDHLAFLAKYPVTGGAGIARQDVEYDGLVAWPAPPPALEFVEIAWGLAALGRPVAIDAAERSERTAARYAAFRATVEQVISVVAPGAPIVTDRINANEARPESMLIDFRGHFHLTYAVPLTAEYEPRLEKEFIEALRNYLVQTHPLVTGADEVSNLPENDMMGLLSGAAE